MTTKDLTTGELETLKQLNEWVREENRFEIPTMTGQLKGYCSSLQRKRLVSMHNGETYFDGEITEEGFKMLETL